MENLDEHAINEVLSTFTKEMIGELKKQKEETGEIKPQILLVTYYANENRVRALELPMASLFFENEESKGLLKPLIHDLLANIGNIKQKVAETIDKDFKAQPLAVIVISDMYVAERGINDPVIRAGLCENRREAIGFIVSTEYTDYIIKFEYSHNEQGQVTFEEPVRADNVSGKLSGLFPKPLKA